MHRQARLFAPLRGAVKWLIAINVAVFVLQSILIAVSPALGKLSDQVFALSPGAVLHGWLWQLVTYAFMHADTGHVLFNMFTLWVFGAGVEDALRRKRFVAFYLMCAVFGAVITVLVSGNAAFARSSLGASGAVMGVAMAFGLLYGNTEIYMIPFPVPFKAKYLVALYMGMDILGLLRSEGGIAYFIHLGGALFGFFYIRVLYPGHLRSAGPLAGLRNAWYRWKRRRAGKKFEVYMQQLEKQSEEETGPDSLPPGKKNGEHRGPWIN